MTSTVLKLKRDVQDPKTPVLYRAAYFTLQLSDMCLVHLLNIACCTVLPSAFKPINNKIKHMGMYRTNELFQFLALFLFKDTCHRVVIRIIMGISCDMRLQLGSCAQVGLVDDT